MRMRHLACAWLWLAFIVGHASHGVQAMEPSRAAQIARRYLASDDSDERDRLAKMLANYEGAIEPVLSRLAVRRFEPVEPGYHPEERFSVAELRDAHPDDLLYFNVPKSYRANRPTGLIIYLHGGGNTTVREAPEYCLDFPDDDEDEESYQLGNLFNATGMIAVGPSAPWDEDSSCRWCLEESDAYLADVIRECKTRFNIDPDRVFLLGHSMGGFGGYHHLQRQGDRFAAVIVHAGSWSLAYLPMFRGTPSCIIAGTHNARPGKRWHYTDVAYGRWTHKLLERKKIDHTYYEHDGEHALYFGKPYIEKYLQATRQLRRDSCYPHIALASPVGFKKSYRSAVRHNRWLSLDETGEGQLEFDCLVSNDADDFADWTLKHRRTKLDGAAIEAVNEGHNTLRVTTQNVERFTIWLHPRMVDFDEPVSVVVNGETLFEDELEPSLLAALESYERRGDWGLVYHAKIELEVPR